MPFTTASLTRMRRGHEHLLAGHQRAVTESLEFGGKHAVSHVNQHPKFKPRTGALQAATKTKVVRTKGGKLLRISNSKPYAGAIDKGARPHVIKAKAGGKLRFKGSGGWVSKSSVNHPGNRPYKFLYRAHRSAGRVIDRNLTQRLTAIASRF